MSDPIYSIPPVWFSPDVTAFAPRLWHWTPELAEKVGKLGTGKGIKIGIGDTGYTKHVDGPEPIAAKSFVPGESYQDGNFHGTHVAGSSLGRNGIGIAPDAELIVGKCLSNGGSGSDSWIANAIRWMAEQGADFINLSLGSSSPSSTINAAIDYALQTFGCITIVAAGNSGWNGGNTLGWPARYNGCLATGAYQENGGISPFSSGGPEIDWACPGSNIVSFANSGSGYRAASGTSMATPVGTGFLAVTKEMDLKAGRPVKKTIAEYKSFFKANLQDAGTPGFDPRFGDGRPVMDVMIQKLVNEELVWA